MFARGRSARGYRGIVSGPVNPHQCPRLLELRLHRLQILIGNVDLFFQRVQLRVLENLPPLALRNLIAGLGRLPVRRDFLVAGRFRRRGLCVARAYSATAEKQQADEDGGNSASDVRPRPSATNPESRGLRSEVRGPRSAVRFPHCPPCGVWAMRTVSPSTTESGGLMMTLSFPSKPATTSTSLPKS